MHMETIIRCYICDIPLTNDVQFDEHGAKPCATCMEIVYDTNNEFDDYDEAISLEDYLINEEADKVS